MTLGPFDLDHPLAQGGMGAVWLARHRIQGVPVAVKLVSEPSEEGVAAFEHEVRAVAGLDHPNVIRVLDFGRLSAETAARWPSVAEGTPWLAMELADAGDLRTNAAARHWSGLRATLLSLLDALAHAHARGVLHRDIKPANVLFAQRGEQAVLKLSDFGMGWRYAADDVAAPLVGGTPRYMSPEQFTGDVPLQGPWTDLYAVGCLAWVLATGHPPFPGRGWLALRKAHVETPIPRLRATFGLPEGFEGWVRGLLAKDPRERFQLAADARWALARLPETARATQGAAGSPGRWMETAPPRTPSPPPTPREWPRPGQSPDVHLSGVGLGLFGLRPVPMVARWAERDAAWSALRDVASGRGPRTLILRGAAGCGKSRLAEWLCETAGEAGVATTLRASHSTAGGPDEGLAGLLARHYHLPLEREHDGLRAWLHRLLAREGRSARRDLNRLVAWLSQGGAEGRLVSAAERHALMVRFLGRLTEHRPAILWLDDAQWGADALVLATRAMGVRGLPLLVVATIQDEALAEGPDASGALEDLVATGAEVLSLAALGPDDRIELAQRLLGLEGELAERIATRTSGNPLFAVQLVGDWVGRGLLTAGADGFRLTEGAKLPLPLSVAEVWEQRTDALVSPHGDAWTVPLQVAATLGMDVDIGEWRIACGRAGSELDRALLTRLLNLRLVRADTVHRNRVAFVHGMLRESVLGAAERAGRAGSLHLACAEMLAERSPQPGANERRGRHLLAAGHWREAVEPMLHAVNERINRGEALQALRGVELLIRSLEPNVPEARGALVEARALQAQVLRLLGRIPRAVAVARRAMEHEPLATPTARVAVLREYAMLLLFSEGATEVFPLLDRARQVAHDAGLDAEEAYVCIERGRALELVGRHDEAKHAFSWAHDVFGRTGERKGLGDAMMGLATVALKQGRYDDAAEHGDHARKGFAAMELTWRMLWCELLLGEVARYRGQLDEAEAHYLSAIARYDMLGVPHQAALGWMNVGLVRCARGEGLEARQAFRRARIDTEAAGLGALARLIDPFELWAAALEADWAAFDRLAAGCEAPSEGGLQDPDLTLALRSAAALAHEAGQADRSARALRLLDILGERYEAKA